MTNPDVIAGLIGAIQNDAGVTAIVGSDVFASEFPDGFTLTPSVLVMPHGGPSGPANLYLNYSRIQVRSYAKTQHLAYVTDMAVYLALKNLTPSIWAHTYIHNAIRATGPLPGLDPTLQWPYSISMWLVKASDQGV